MGKKAKSQSKEGAPVEAAPTSTASTSSGTIPLVATKVDPGLAALFAQSAGPVKAPELKPAYRNEGKYQRRDEVEVEDEDEEGDEQEEEEEEEKEEEEEDDDEEDEDVEMGDMEEDDDEDEKKSRKRKRGAENEDLEAAYLQRLTREEDRERKKDSTEKPKRMKADNPAEEAEESDEEAIPTHESLSAKTPQTDAIDKASRTLFLSNVSTEAIKSKSAKKTLLTHLSSLLPKSSSTVHKVESLRFRSTAFSSTALPRRAAYAKKELMDSTTKGTNAYVVYSTVLAAKKALKLNGSIVLDRHIRVDSVARPSVTDHTRCVFVGNLGFVDEEQTEEKKKKKVSADVEEGLWRTFTAHCGGEGVVESVRVVRDRLTRVGKGFAYVQFKDENGVEAALLCDGKKYPPMLPRRLRVTRAKKVAVGSEGVRE
ncbi:hypothetical protein FQN49_007176 [Arthroderma sp. PD_2]|nr:hypothetical protein FQN49_007176 [Arthroderma sp. PD_2]